MSPLATNESVSWSDCAILHSAFIIKCKEMHFPISLCTMYMYCIQYIVALPDWFGSRVSCYGGRNSTNAWPDHPALSPGVHTAHSSHVRNKWSLPRGAYSSHVRSEWCWKCKSTWSLYDDWKLHLFSFLAKRAKTLMMVVMMKQNTVTLKWRICHQLWKGALYKACFYIMIL